MKTSARAWIPSTLCLIAACEQPSTELGSTREVWAWVSEDDEAIDAVATTPDDEVVVILSRQFDGGGVLRKHAPDGSIAWSQESVRMIDVSVDATGTIFALGRIGDDASSLLAHAPDGQPLWEAPLPAGTRGAALGVRDDGTILVAANTGDAAELLAFLPAGDLAWARPLVSDEVDDLPLVTELATSAAGHVAVTGSFDNGTWAARLSPTGDIVWLHLSIASSMRGLAIDDAGAAFVVGRLGLQLLLRRFDPAGAVTWERVEPVEAHRFGHAAAIGEDGTLYWTGIDETDAIVVALEPDGTERWHERVSGPPADVVDEDHAIGVALAPTGELVAAGSLDYRGRGGPDAWFRGWIGRYATGE